MARTSDIRVRAAELYFLPVQTRMPYQFGRQVLTAVTCARGRVWVEDRNGHVAEGWGETPLNLLWAWPTAEASYETLERRLQDLTMRLGQAWTEFDAWGHPMEIGYDFLQQVLPSQVRAEQEEQPSKTVTIPRLAALICASVWDQAIHDAYGNLLQRPTYTTYNATFLNRDLAAFLEPAEDAEVEFAGRYPEEFLVLPPKRQLWAWHSVGGLDPLTPADRTGQEPQDGYPVVLTEWIEQDGLKCLKVKLRGNEAEWDYKRLVQVGQIGLEQDVNWLCADFNCTAPSVDYVNQILDRLREEYPRIYGMLLYVEQPFPYELEEHRLDVHSISARKPLFLDESAHDWQMVRLGRRLGWTGVALKSCKTLTNAVLTTCWAIAHGMTLMVQDLTNPMLAQIAHLGLAAHVPTLMGAETNSMQFYPEASRPEAEVHPGMFRRRNGQVDLSTLGSTGLGYRISEIRRSLPTPIGTWGTL